MRAVIPEIKEKTPSWNEEHTEVIKLLKQKIKFLPCLSIPDPNAKLIVETDASDLGYGGILKQKVSELDKERIVRFH